MPGGDLDGDIFSVIYDSELVPSSTSIRDPMNFTPGTLPSSRDDIRGLDI